MSKTEYSTRMFGISNLVLLLCCIAWSNLTLVSPSQARSHYRIHKSTHHRAGHLSDNGRPHAWCGWQMRQWFGGGAEYNLARNWAHRGSPAGGPGIGVIVVWAHHVGVIVGGSSGHWVVKSGNDGHAVRSRVRSVAGAIAFRRLGA